MKLRYKPKIDSMLSFLSMPVRIPLLLMAGIFMLFYYLLGFLSVNNDLPTKTGIVHQIYILQDAKGWEVNFTLEGDASKLYWQSYTTNFVRSLLFPPKSKIEDCIISKGDTITFFVDGSKSGKLIGSIGLSPFVASVKNKRVVYTEGLIVNGEEVASPLVVSFTRTSIEWVGLIGSSFLFFWFVLFIFDVCIWYDKRWTEKKVKRYFSQRNSFIW